MLQEILAGDGYVDPEILAELDEDQKQILFCKMREEQVRRYYDREKKLSKEEKKNQNNKKKNGKRVDFLLGSDKNIWVWVMGEHKSDRTIEEILENEAKTEAEKEAEKEAETFRKAEEDELAQLAKEEAKLEAERKEKEERLRKEAEAEYQSAKEAREAQQRLEDEKKKTAELQRKKFDDLKRRKERRRSSMKEIEGMKTKRSSEIYQSIQEVRARLEIEAKKSQAELDKEWKKQEEKAKRLESQIRNVARRARQEWRKSITSDNDLAKVAFKILEKHKSSENNNQVKSEQPNTANGKSATQSVPKKPEIKAKPTRPQSRESIIQWYKDKERHKGAGFDTRTNDIAPWFHGPITRESAEELLEEKQAGTFLVRVSERIFGYAISYRSEARCKHYLINALDDKYEFFGTNQISHRSLQDLVNFHKKTPVSNTGQEILKYPCEQSRDPPDYAVLFDSAEVTKL